jgi:phasin family protein
MNSFQATGFPLASTDLIKAWHHFKLPALSIGALLETHRKNAAALANANQVVFNGVKTLAKHQGDLFAASVNDCSQAVSEFLAATSFEARSTKQADAARYAYVSSVACLRELSDIAAKANLTAVDILNARVIEAFDEFRTLFAAPPAPITAASVAPTSVIAAPASVVEEGTAVGEAAVPVEPEPTVTNPTTTPTTAARVAKSSSTNASKTAAPAAKSRRHSDRAGDRLTGR